MNIVIATNSDTVEVARRCGVQRIDFLFDAGLADAFCVSEPRREEQCGFPLKLIWTGALVPRKALVLALDAMALVTEDV